MIKIPIDRHWCYDSGDQELYYCDAADVTALEAECLEMRKRLDALESFVELVRALADCPHAAGYTAICQIRDALTVLPKERP